jgi:histidinol-phosphate aminotransferase
VRLVERIHGGIDAAAPGIDAREVLDLSVNLNPYGPPSALLEAVQAAALTRYPDAHARTAREAWARELDTSPERIAVGHGAADLMWAVARAFLRPGQRVVVAEPTFSELRVAAISAGASVERVFSADATLRLDLDAVLAQARGARMVYVCAPNNPTGEGVGAGRIAALAEALGDTLLVLDQSFLSLSDDAADVRAPLPANVIALRSLTKDFALPGLRIGYLVAAPELVVAIEAARPTWATSAPALAAIACAAREQAFVQSSWQRIRADRSYLEERLAGLGLWPLPSATGYLLVPVGNAPVVTQKLLAQRVFVRDASSFGLPGHVRIAARPRAEVDRLCEAWTRAELDR